MQLEPKESFFAVHYPKMQSQCTCLICFLIVSCFFFLSASNYIFLLTPSTFIYLCLCFCQHPTPNLFILHAPCFSLAAWIFKLFLFCPSLAFRLAPFLTLDVLFSSNISHSLTLTLCLTLNISIPVSVL